MQDKPALRYRALLDGVVMPAKPKLFINLDMDRHLTRFLSAIELALALLRI